MAECPLCDEPNDGPTLAHEIGECLHRLRRERDEAKRNARAWADERDSMRRERDEARAEVERLRALLDGYSTGEG